ncbi:ANTH domain-containing protein [Lipomyces oligophaga]|uniref:ANTH domain-containing protein n=1 Tax=Lipomyces oligophaga TaxID=45792 RepID=UPI0034CE61F8
MAFDKIVKGATKIKLAAPKAKYIEPIVDGTRNELELEDIFRCLSSRLRDSAWTIVFKSLIVIHIMIREGRKEAALEYLSHHGRMLDCSHMGAANAGREAEVISSYSKYLQERVKQYASIKRDFVRTNGSAEGRLRKLSVEKGLLRETESVQSQLRALLRAKFEPENDISLTAFRLLVLDLLSLHQVVNEGMINILEHYFEMSKFDAERGLDIYQDFVKEMNGVIKYLQLAKKHESMTRLQVPNIKHAPTSLAKSLEEYLNDPEFDVNRRQFLAEKEAKLGSGMGDEGHAVISHGGGPGSPVKSPEAALENYFATIEQQVPVFPDNTGVGIQQPMSTGYQQPMATGFQQPMTTGYQQALVSGNQVGSNMQQPSVALNPDFTGAGFGGYSSQVQPTPLTTATTYMQAVDYSNRPTAQNNYQGLFSSDALQQPSVFTNAPNFSSSPTTALVAQSTGTTNPFRASSTNTQFTGISPQYTGVKNSGGSSNPFHLAKAPSYNLNAVPEYEPATNLGQQSLVRQNTTNPFMKSMTLSTNGSSVPPPVTTAMTNSTSLTRSNTGTNPFRQSMV